MLVLSLVSLLAHAGPQDELKSLRARIEALRGELERSEGERQDARDALRHSERAISEQERELRALESRQAAIRQELAALSLQTGAANADLDRQREQWIRLLRARHLAGAPEPLRLLLYGTDPDQTARRLSYYRYVAQARREATLRLKASLAELDRLHAAGAAQAEQLARAAAAERERRAALEKVHAERAEVLTRVAGEIKARRGELSTLVRDQQRLTDLVERLRREAEVRRQAELRRQAEERRQAKAARPGELRNRAVPDASVSGQPFAALKGRLALPVQGALTQRYGSTESETGAVQKGVFIRAPSGEPVRAVASGLVVFADWLRGFGNLAIVDHGGSYMSLYANTYALYKQVGERVKAGDVIAAVGNSGGRQESGLYFELRFQSRPFDPLGWVKLR